MSSPDRVEELRRANAAYERGDFDAALRRYLDLSMESCTDPSVTACAWEGIGNCHEAQRRFGLARTAWIRARQMFAAVAGADSAWVAAIDRRLRAQAHHPMAFLSYTWANKKRVHALVHAMTDVGCRITFDADCFAAGMSLQEQIDLKLAEAPAYLVAWSKQYRGRPYTEYELQALVRYAVPGFRDAGHVGRQVVLLRLDDEPLPSDWRDVLHIDARRRTAKRVAAQVLESLGRSGDFPF